MRSLKFDIFDISLLNFFSFNRKGRFIALFKRSFWFAIILDRCLLERFCKPWICQKSVSFSNYEFRHSISAGWTVRNINEVLAKEATSESTIRRRLESSFVLAILVQNEPCGWPEGKVDNVVPKAVLQAGTSQTMRELAIRFEAAIATILVHMDQIGKVKNLEAWVLHK